MTLFRPPSTSTKVQIYVAASYGFVKAFAQLSTSKNTLSAKRVGGNLTSTAAAMLHQFLGGQQVGF